MVGLHFYQPSNSPMLNYSTKQTICRVEVVFDDEDIGLNHRRRAAQRRLNYS